MIMITIIFNNNDDDEKWINRTRIINWQKWTMNKNRACSTLYDKCTHCTHANEKITNYLLHYFSLLFDNNQYSNVFKYCVFFCPHSLFFFIFPSFRAKVSLNCLLFCFYVVLICSRFQWHNESYPMIVACEAIYIYLYIIFNNKHFVHATILSFSRFPRSYYLSSIRAIIHEKTQYVLR